MSGRLCRLRPRPRNEPDRKEGFGLALKQDGSVIAWGCRDADSGQCNVPATASTGVTAIVAGEGYNLALKQDGSVIAWGCGPSAGYPRDFGQCTVPADAAKGCGR